MSDLLYHTNKIKRKFEILINIWGVDHFGYVKRLKSALRSLNLKEAELTCDDLLEHCHELMYIDRVLTESGLTKTGRRLKLIAALRRMKSVEDSRHLSTKKSRSHVLDSIRQTRPSNSKQNSSLKPSLVKGSSSTNPSLAMPGSTRDSKRNLVLP